MKIQTKQSNSCRYFVKELPVIDQGGPYYPMIILQNSSSGQNS